MFRMPSDSKKRQLQKKKDAAKARQNVKPAGSKGNDANGVTNGDEIVPISEEGNLFLFYIIYKCVISRDQLLLK